LAGAVSEDVRIVGDRQKFLEFGRVVEDRYSGQGPLAGIHAALEETRADLNLILAVDLPFLDPALLVYLCSQASQTGAVATVPQAAGGWQPLCAVYRREFREVAEPALRKGKNKIDKLFARVETRAVREEELIRMGYSPAMFRNLNTAQEFERVQRDYANLWRRPE
jgi:molybdenum cofactor guanylyltransferase